eukprot:TRINITY_DN10050_c0_g4_i1.p1 TRINITY_DN10050_c0_g4~~TRINITY_DN10050_c0_g4_i1.p1  ORF type:complete len:397 (-),score=119.66 TRINITY_DN10050_c0_g4_i1:89-1279(-)
MANILRSEVDLALRKASLDYLETVSMSSSSSSPSSSGGVVADVDDGYDTDHNNDLRVVDVDIHPADDLMKFDNNGRPIIIPSSSITTSDQNSSSSHDNNSQSNNNAKFSLNSIFSSFGRQINTEEKQIQEEEASSNNNSDFYSLAADGSSTMPASLSQRISSGLLQIFSEWPRSLLLCIKASTAAPIPEIGVWAICSGITLGLHALWAVASALVLLGNYRLYIWSLSGSLMNAFLLPFMFTFWTFGCVQRLGNVTGWSKSIQILEQEATVVIDGETVVDTVELELLQAIEKEKRQLSSSQQIQIIRIWTCLCLGTFEWCLFVIMYLVNPNSPIDVNEIYSKKTILVIFQTVSYFIFSVLVLTAACSGNLVNAGNFSLCFKASRQNFEALSNNPLAA